MGGTLSPGVLVFSFPLQNQVLKITPRPSSPLAIQNKKDTRLEKNLKKTRSITMNKANFETKTCQDNK